MTWAAHYATPEGLRYWPCEELVRAVARRRRVDGVENLGDVLEVGCGNGANLWFLSEHADRVVGLDVSVPALELAGGYMRARNPKRVVDLKHGDLAATGYENQSFDTVVDCMASQHLPWDAHANIYREYRRVLRPGGWLFLYHLDSATETTHEWVRGSLGCDATKLGLFPTVDLVCLLDRTVLRDVVVAAGFKMPNVNGLARQYDNGDVASYAVIDAEAS